MVDTIVMRAPLQDSAAGFDVRDGVLVVVIDPSVPDDRVPGMVRLAQGLSASHHSGQWTPINREVPPL